MNDYKQKITLKANDNFKEVRISNSMDINNYARQFYHEDLTLYESFFIAMLDRKNNTIGWAKIGQGGVHMCPVDVKIIAKYAIDNLASQVILVHNHPSGGLRPSMEDIGLTDRVKKGLRLLDIDVLDHVILTKDSYYSFADEGRI